MVRMTMKPGQGCIVGIADAGGGPAPSSMVLLAEVRLKKLFI